MLTFVPRWDKMRGMGVSKREQIMQMVQLNRGVIRISDIVAKGITRQYAIRMMEELDCERVAKGIYLSPDAWQDDLYILSLQYKKVVFSHETALYMQGLSMREPDAISITVPRDYKVNASGFYKLKKYSVVDSRYELGLESVHTTYGHTIPCYNTERTLCDIFRSETEPQIRQFAMKEYLKRKRNLPQLMEYAEQMHVASKIRQYLEVLL